VADPTLNRLRRLWFDVHMWLGVGLLVVLVPLSISGVVLAWRPEIDRMAHPARYAVSGGAAVLGPSAYLAAASQAAGPRFKADRLTYPSRPDSPVLVYGGGRRSRVGVWLDPVTAKVLAEGPMSDPLVGVMHDLHEQLFIEGVGRQIVGVLGGVMLIQALTGLWLWWPRTAGFLKGLRWGRSPFLDARLHYFTGFWVAIPLAILAATGIILAFPNRPPGPPRVAEAASPTAEPRGAAPGLDADQALAAALKASPGASVVSISAPNPGTPAWRLQLTPAGGDLPVTVKVAGVPGAPVTTVTSGPSDPIGKWSGRLHAGEELGVVWRIITSIAGMAPLLFAWTGLTQWLRGRRRRAV